MTFSEWLLENKLMLRVWPGDVVDGMIWRAALCDQIEGPYVGGVGLTLDSAISHLRSHLWGAKTLRFKSYDGTERDVVVPPRWDCEEGKIW